MCDSMCLSFSPAKVGNACYTLLSYVLQTCYKAPSRIRHPVPSSPPPTCLPLPGSLYLPPYAAGRVCKRNEIMLIFAATKRMTS